MATKRQLLFIQGAGESTHDQWDNKLVASLEQGLGPDHEVHYPRMPTEDAPSYAAWKPTLEGELRALRKGAILVGHSVGGTILLKALTEQTSAQAPRAIVLIAAPFVGEGGWSEGDAHLPPDLGARLPQGVPIHFFHGLEDDIAPPSHVELYARAVPQAHIHRLSGRDHQLDNDLKEVAAVVLSLER